MDPVAALAWAALGAVLGAGAGLVPGLHPNTLATGVLLVALDGATGATPVGTAAAAGFHTSGAWAVPLLSGLLGAWTFANAVPLIVLGVPDGDDAPALLPGQRLARDGKVPEAIHASARGSLVGLAAGSLAALALAWAIARYEPASLIQQATPWVQAVALVVLVATDPAGPIRAGLVAALAGALGLAALGTSVSSPIGLPATPLAPLFIGLFGLPALTHAARAGDPEATPAWEGRVRRVRTPGTGSGLVGTGLGLFAGTFAGFTSGPATAIAVLVKRGRDEHVLATTAAVNTSAVCVATAMLHAAGRTRTGVHAAQLALAPPAAGLAPLASSLAAVALGGVVGLVLLALASRGAGPISRAVPRIAPVLAVAWIAIIGLQTGLAGFLITAAAWATARTGAALGSRRSVLMASLLVPGLVDALGVSM